MTQRPLWGDCHVHSTRSDGCTPIRALTPSFEAFGLDFRIQTDHWVIEVPAGRPAGRWLHAADWAGYAAECAAASTERHLCLAGLEIGWEAGGAGDWFDTKLYPRAGAASPDESFFAGKSWPQALRGLREAGHRVVVAHVDQGAPLSLLAGDEIDGLEVRWDIEETRPLPGRATLREWDRMLAAGRRVSLSSGSDAHQPDEWAGSSLRTVVLDTRREEEAILESVAAGRSYLSGTRHPDVYGELGCPGHANSVAGGSTRFTPWWDAGKVPGFGPGREAEFVRRGFDLALARGRCRREDYPELVEYRVGEASCGGEVAPAANVPVRVAWRTRVPASRLRLVAGGRVILECVPAGNALETSVDLRGAKSIRLELEAGPPAESGPTEVILANPVYVVPR